MSGDSTSSSQTRYQAAHEVGAAAGWRAQRLTQPSRLYGANGLRTGADGRIYVAQVAGSQVSAIDIDTGAIETISPMGGNIVAPDDLAFDEDGNLYSTEITEGRVSVLQPDGQYRIINGDMPCANPITYHQGHLYAGECRPDGRIMELDRNGGPPKILLENVPAPNAFEIGPDGKLYFPVMGTNEIWRIDPQGGAPEVVARDLGVPDAVKFDAQGFIVSTQVASGQVLRIDPATGEKTVLADIGPGLDNLTFVDGRLFVSSISGQVVEILEPGKFRPLVSEGLQWPLDVAVGEDGGLFVVDGGFTYTLAPGGQLQLAGMLFTPGFPGYSRGVAAAGPGEWVVTTANGEVSRYWPGRAEHEVITSGFDQLMGVAIATGGTILFAEYGTGRVHSVDAGGVSELAGGLHEPKGVAIGADGRCYVAESTAGRVAALSSGGTDTVLDGLQKPEGIAVRGGRLYVLDIGARELYEHDLERGSTAILATALPVGAPEGVVARPLGGVGAMCGPMGNFTGIDVGPDGTVYVSADAEGSVIAVSPVSG